jgi:hypothetical protein
MFALVRDRAIKENESLRAIFRAQYCRDHCQFVEDNEPELAEVLQQVRREDEQKQGREFDRLYIEALALWSALSSSAVLEGFKKVRDTVSAQAT